MSVIIRLQNLPWSANAADIRQFFHGLAIPEGGVHIVGGAAGDAFIAFSSDEDARQGIALNGGVLRDARVKLFLSSRTEMQKIIEETRQQHLAAMQATTMGTTVKGPMSSAPSVAYRPPNNILGSVGDQFPSPIPPTGHLNPSSSAVRPDVSNNNAHPFYPGREMDISNGHQTRPGSGYDQPFHSQQQQQQQPYPYAQHPFNQNQRMPQHVNSHTATFGPNVGSQQHGYGHSGGPRMRGPGDGMSGGYARDMPGVPSGMPQDMQGHPGPGPIMMDRFGRERRDVRNSPDFDRGGPSFQGRDRFRDRRERDRDSSRRGRRTRSRSRSPSPRGRAGRDRRHRSRSDSLEKRRSSRDRDRERDRDRNGKSNKSSAPSVEADVLQSAKQKTANSEPEPEPNTSIQLRLLDGDLTYRDLREYFEGIHIPNQFIKMINSFDGRRFGLAYIRFLTKADKQNILARHNGTIRSHSVQVFHVEDSTFNQAVDSYSPGCAVDPRSLSQQCLALHKFPPFGTAKSVQEAFGSISIGRVLPERNESGTVTGLCYAELANEVSARMAPQLLKDGVMISGHKVFAAFLPLEELEVCSKNLEKFRSIPGGPTNSMGVASVGLRREDTPRSPEPPPFKGTSAPAVGLQYNSSLANAGNGSYDLGQRASRSMVQPRVYITGLPPTAMERDVGDFFSDVGAIPQTIEIVYDENRSPVGKAYCQFGSMQEAERALDKNGGFMGGTTVTVTLVDQPTDQLPGSVHPAATHSIEDGSHFNAFPGLQDGPGPRVFGHPGPNAPSYNRQPLRSSMDGSQYGGHRFTGARGSFMGNGPRGSNRPMMRMRMPLGPGIQNGGRNAPSVGEGDGSPTPGFGAPGCVVALSNVHHSAVIADILNFFRGFQVGEKSVIRRFGPNGEPTGDARVAFLTPEEAQRAVFAMQNQYILNRRVSLSIV